jgi:hypothetical protein
MLIESILYCQTQTNFSISLNCERKNEVIVPNCNATFVLFCFWTKNGVAQSFAKVSKKVFQCWD